MDVVSGLPGMFPSYSTLLSFLLTVPRVRFETRDVCDEIIRQFNNTPVFSKRGGEEYLIQLRFADTSEQKALKQQTAAARQYRTAEYESQTQVRGNFFDSVRMNTMPTLSTVPSMSSICSGPRPMNSEFEQYMASRSVLFTPPFVLHPN